MIMARMHNFLMDHGTGKEDGNVMCNVVLLTIMQLCRGEKVLVIVADCCGTGNCALLDWFCTFVVDELGWFEAAGVVYFWTNHGKGPADGRFGAHRSVHEKRTSTSMAQYGLHLEDVKNKRTGATDTTTILHACGLTDWKKFAIERTGNRVPYPPEFGLRGGNRHEVFAYRKSGTLPKGLSAYLAPFAGGPGWVKMREHADDPDTAVKGFCFYPPTAPATRNATPPPPRMATRNTADEYSELDMEGERRAPNRKQVVKIGHDFYNLKDKIADMKYSTIPLFRPDYVGFVNNSTGVEDLRVRPLSIFESRPCIGKQQQQPKHLCITASPQSLRDSSLSCL
jgi:hypothetical protein